MDKRDFYTRVRGDQKNVAEKVNGPVDEERGIGYYQRESGIWTHAIDLKSGMSVATASCISVTKRCVTQTWDRIMEVRESEHYQKLCKIFAVEVAEAKEVERDG